MIVKYSTIVRGYINFTDVILYRIALNILENYWLNIEQPMVFILTNLTKECWVIFNTYCLMTIEVDFK